MTFDITIECDNLAFDGNACGPEIARILSTIIKRIEPWSREEIKAAWCANLYDINGNRVGEARSSTTPAEDAGQ